MRFGVSVIKLTSMQLIHAAEGSLSSIFFMGITSSDDVAEVSHRYPALETLLDDYSVFNEPPS